MPHRSSRRLDPPDALRHRVQRIMEALTCRVAGSGKRAVNASAGGGGLGAKCFELWEKTSRVARVTGLEPATSGVTGRRSNQLSYTRTRLVGGEYGGGRGVSSAGPR